MTTDTAPTTEKAPKVPTACQCFTVEIGTEDGIAVYGPCTGTTNGTFAPGHDAKLKSVLQRLFVAGQPYVVNDGATRTEGDPMRKAAERGWEHFLVRAQERAEQAQAKKATEETHPTPSGHDVIDGPAASAPETRKTTRKEIAK